MLPPGKRRNFCLRQQPPHQPPIPRGKTYRIQRRKRLGQIHPQPILPPLPRRRKQADQIKIQPPVLRPRRIKRDGQRIIAIRRTLPGNKHILMLRPRPLDTLGLDLDAPKHLLLLPAQRRLQRRREHALVRAADVEGPGVLGGGFDVHAPEARVGEADLSGFSGDGDGVGERRGEGGREFLELEGGGAGVGDGGPGVEGDGVFQRGLEGAVADEFGVDAAVARVVDVLWPGVRCGLEAERGRGKVPRASARKRWGWSCCRPWA